MTPIPFIGRRTTLTLLNDVTQRIRVGRRPFIGTRVIKNINLFDLVQSSGAEGFLMESMS